MKSSTVYICYIFLLGSIIANAQDRDALKQYAKKIERTQAADARYHIYDPPFLAKPTMENVEEALNRYPEEFMISKISENTRGWFVYNSTKEDCDKSPIYFQQKKHWDKDKTYYELTSKLEFTYNSVIFILLPI